MPFARLGVIGGSGLYEMEGLTEVEEVKVSTPFGEPSDSIVVGKLEGVPIAFLPRHSRGHRILPTELPARANIYALKSLGVEWVISVSAVGSLRQELAPMHLIIPDQIIDRTKSRVNTFFGEGLVAHVAFAEPFCPQLSQAIYQAATQTKATVHQGGTLVVMEGPLFSTKAESNLYRSWGADLIGMTALPEAKLAREAEMCYATLACVTDYDVWHEVEEDVTIEMIIQNLVRNVANAKSIIHQVARHLPSRDGCPCPNALQNAIVTDAARIPAQMKKDLQLLIGKYIPAD